MVFLRVRGGRSLCVPWARRPPVFAYRAAIAKMCFALHMSDESWSSARTRPTDPRSKVSGPNRPSFVLRWPEAAPPRDGLASVRDGLGLDKTSRT